MAEKIKINVTAEDIKKGKPDDSEKCPVALAVKRVFKRPIRVNWENNVEEDSWARSASMKAAIAVKYKDGVVLYKLPSKVADKIKKFDLDDKKMEPFEFEIGL